MSNHIKQFKQFIYDSAGDNTHQINEENLQYCLKSVEGCLRAFFKGRKPSLSPSGMSVERRKMWHLLNKTKGYNKDQFKPTSRIKMLVSSVAEFIIVFLMKEAGIKIHNEQDKLNMEFQGVKMKGSCDYGLDGKMHDFKCCSGDNYRVKWKNTKTLLEHDEFGYIIQLPTYHKGAEWSTGVGGWDVYNLDTGDIKHISAKKLDYEMDMSIEHFEEKLKDVKRAKSWEEFPPCHQPIITKSGVEQLDWRCARCPFVKTCWGNKYEPTKKNINQISYIKRSEGAER